MFILRIWIKMLRMSSSLVDPAGSCPERSSGSLVDPAGSCPE